MAGEYKQPIAAVNRAHRLPKRQCPARKKPHSNHCEYFDEATEGPPDVRAKHREREFDASSLKHTRTREGFKVKFIFSYQAKRSSKKVVFITMLLEMDCTLKVIQTPSHIIYNQIRFYSKVAAHGAVPICSLHY